MGLLGLCLQLEQRNDRTKGYPVLGGLTKFKSNSVLSTGHPKKSHPGGHRTGPQNSPKHVQREERGSSCALAWHKVVPSPRDSAEELGEERARAGGTWQDVGIHELAG